MDTEYPEDWRGNPILSSPRTTPPQRAKMPSAALERMILGLGLRYRPQRQDQLEAHQAKIAALIADLIDVPLGPLEKACGQWIAKSPFMPKASDLIELAQATVAPPPVATSLQAWCDQRNAAMHPRSPHWHENVEWRVHGKGENASVALRWKDSPDPHGPPYCTPEEAKAILREHPSSFARAMLSAIESRAP